MQFLSRLFSKNPPFSAAIAPKTPFFAIGDVHGRDDLLVRLLERVPSGAQIVFVGDYVDRGEQSAQVLRRIYEMTESGNIVCLRGNHEQMMINFLDDPAKHGGRWLRYGGLQTMASFQISVSKPNPDPSELRDIAAALEQSMGAELTAWLRALPLIWATGNVTVVHAAADPEVSMDGQTENALLWGHPEFGKKPRTDGIWVVHGHTIVDAASAKDGVISVDTGAFATGRLTGAHVTDGGVEFVAA